MDEMVPAELPQNYTVEDLPANECWALLRRCDLGRMATCGPHGPEIVPINYSVDRGSVVFRTAEGTKLDAARNLSAVAFEIDGVDTDSGLAWSVIIRGQVSRIREMSELIDTSGLPIYPLQGGAKPTFVRITATQVTGRRFRITS